MKTILLIEDDAWLGELYSDVLRAAGFAVVHALDGQTGIEKLDETPIDLIILDLLLSGHNGIGVLHELRSYPDLAEIPVIIQSNLEPERSGLHRDAWHAYGVVEYIFKVDARPQELVRAASRIIGAPHETV
ncbi:MAG TPA: response regulator [Candidatus Saccharimonadales bacterium]|nr:response regulator [Candidatus Saccharimonadales bacterium]